MMELVLTLFEKSDSNCIKKVYLVSIDDMALGGNIV